MNLSKENKWILKNEVNTREISKVDRVVLDLVKSLMITTPSIRPLMTYQS